MTTEPVNNGTQITRDKFRQRLTFVYLAFLMVWFVFIAVLVWRVGIGVVEALALGTATGIFLAAFKDMWQFVWRKN